VSELQKITSNQANILKKKESNKELQLPEEKSESRKSEGVQKKISQNNLQESVRELTQP
jgi:hypothetical protein